MSTHSTDLAKSFVKLLNEPEKWPEAPLFKTVIVYLSPGAAWIHYQAILYIIYSEISSTERSKNCQEN